MLPFLVAALLALDPAAVFLPPAELMPPIEEAEDDSEGEDIMFDTLLQKMTPAAASVPDEPSPQLELPAADLTRSVSRSHKSASDSPRAISATKGSTRTRKRQTVSMKDDFEDQSGSRRRLKTAAALEDDGFAVSASQRLRRKRTGSMKDDFDDTTTPGSRRPARGAQEDTLAKYERALKEAAETFRPAVLARAAADAAARAAAVARAAAAVTTAAASRGDKKDDDDEVSVIRAVKGSSARPSDAWELLPPGALSVRHRTHAQSSTTLLLTYGPVTTESEEASYDLTPDDALPAVFHTNGVPFHHPRAIAPSADTQPPEDGRVWRVELDKAGHGCFATSHVKFILSPVRLNSVRLLVARYMANTLYVRVLAGVQSPAYTRCKA